MQFEARLNKFPTRANKAGEVTHLKTTIEHVQEALDEVGRNAFPNRVLENQKAMDEAPFM